EGWHNRDEGDDWRRYRFQPRLGIGSLCDSQRSARQGSHGHDHAGTQSFMVKPEINSAADLKGKIVGVSGFGGSTHHGALLVLEHLDVDTKDVSILNVGNSALRLAALRFKKIDATILDTAFVRKAEELGSKGSSRWPISAKFLPRD